MAETYINPTDLAVRKAWADKLLVTVLKTIEYNTFVGSDENSPIQQKFDLKKGAGDEIRFSILRPLRGKGVVGAAPWTGNEEALDYRTAFMKVDEFGHSVSPGAVMDIQRVPFNFLKDAEAALRDWWVQNLSDQVVSHLVGDSRFRVADATLGQNPVEPDAGHLIGVNGKVTAATLTSADVADLSFFRAMKQRAQMPAAGCDKIRPLIIKGKPYYRILGGTYVIDNLRLNYNDGEIGDWARNAAKLDIPDADFEVEGMIFTKSERMPTWAAADGSQNAYRTVLVGAQAAMLAWGGAGQSIGTALNFSVETRDHGRKTSVAGGGVLGFNKTRFDSKDYGVITGLSYAEPIQ